MKAPAIMSTQAKREYVALKHTEYKRCVTRAQKHELIREVASTCDFSVKYVIRRLNHPLPTRKVSSSRRKTYTQEDLFWLKRIWRECDFACGKLLCALVALVLESLQKSGEQVPKDTQERLLKMSPATIDRALRPYRVERPKKRSGSVLTTLRKEVSVKALRSSQCREPGHLGLDSVALCGGSLAGKFFWILTLTDVFSGYTLIAPVWNKTAENVAEALDKMLCSLPFDPVEIHPDNGSEFLNSVVYRRIKSRFPKCSVSRSRPYHKNDNAHVEQKNGAVVRRLFGELRFDELSRLESLEQICALANVRTNHFLACRKLQSKQRDPLSGLTSKSYDKAKTPVQRLLDSGLLSEHSRETLPKQASNTHLLALNRELFRLLKLASSQGVEHAQPLVTEPTLRCTFK